MGEIWIKIANYFPLKKSAQLDEIKPAYAFDASKRCKEFLNVLIQTPENQTPKTRKFDNEHAKKREHDCLIEITKSAKDF